MATDVKRTVLGLRSIAEQHKIIHSPLQGGLVGSAILTLLQTYNAYRYDVYSLMPKKIRHLLFSPSTHDTIASIILQGLDRTGALSLLNQPEVTVQQFSPAENRSNTSGNVSCVYHISYRYRTVNPKGYVGRTFHNKDRQKRHTKNASSVQEQSKYVHYKYAKDCSSKVTSVVCLLNNMDSNDIKALEEALDDEEERDLYLWDERRLTDQIETENEDCTQGDRRLENAIQFLVEQLVCDLFGSLAPATELLAMGMKPNAIERSSVARFVATDALAQVGWVPLYDRHDFAGPASHGLNSVLPWMTIPMSQKTKWFKTRLPEGTTYRCSTKAYKKQSRPYCFLDLADFENASHVWKGTLGVSLGKPHDGLENGTEVEFVVEHLENDAKHPQAYFLPAGIDVLRHPEMRKVQAIAFRIDWNDKQEYLSPKIYDVSNERANFVLAVTSYLDGEFDPKFPSRLPPKIIEEVLDPATFQLQELQYHVKPAEDRQATQDLVCNPTSIIEDYILGELKLTKSDFCLEVTGEECLRKFRQGTKSKTVSKACDNVS